MSKEKLQLSIPIEVTLINSLTEYRKKGFKKFKATSRPHEQSGIKGTWVAVEFKKGKDEREMPVFIDNRNEKKKIRIIKLFEDAAETVNKL